MGLLGTVRFARIALWLAAALMGAQAAAAPAPQQIEGTVSRVIDGDSLWFDPAAGGAPLQLRLQDIDAPEICQPWGPEAKAALADLVLKQPARVRISGRDTHGRTLGTLFVGERNINKVMVQEGHAWSNRFKYDRGPYVADERMAKALSRGFNQFAGAVMPKDFRREHGPCQVEAAAAASTMAVTAVAAAPRCDGRKHCSQMRSCAEATWFLKNCPGVEMDGNRDGVPCEKQWCRP